MNTPYFLKPTVIQWREAALELRKHAIKFDKIAQDLENKESKKL
jgi:hypothetical protein